MTSMKNVQFSHNKTKMLSKAEPGTCLEHCLDSNNTYTNYSSGHPISVDLLPVLPPPVTIDFRLIFYLTPPPPASTPSTGCHKCMAPTLEFFNIRSLQIYLGQKLVYLGIFGLKSYMRSAPSNLPNCKVWCKITILKFGTILICVFLGVEFENTIVILETNTSNLSNCKISRTRMPKFGTKNA